MLRGSLAPPLARVPSRKNKLGVMALTFDSPESQAALASVRFPPVPAENCSASEAGSIAGTATHAKNWFALEQPGSWGRDILDGTAFDRDLAEKVSAAVKKAGDYKFVLIRKPGSRGSARMQDDAARRVFIARTGPGQQELFTFTVSGPEELLSLPLKTPEKIPGVQRWDSQVVTLVCAHSRRDQCCALRGRPIASYLASLRPEGTVWECSHLSGHRFAPTGLVLPSGYTYGRLTPETALAATVCLEETGVPSLANLRGRACLTQEQQVAEIAVRSALFDASEESDADAFSFDLLDSSWDSAITAGSAPQQRVGDGAAPSLEKKAKLTLVRHRDGRRWQVATTSEKVGPVRESCRKKPKMVSSMRVLSVEELKR